MPIDLKNLRRDDGGINIPVDESKFNCKVVIVNTATSAETDITDECVGSLSYSKINLRNGISNGSITILNENSQYDDLLVEPNRIKVYAEYTDGTPTDVLLDWFIVDVYDNLNESYAWHKSVSISQSPMSIQRTVTITFNDPVNTDEAIKQLIDTYLAGFVTYTNLPSISNTKVQGSFEDQAPHTLIAKWLEDAGYDGYLDNDNDIHAHLKGEAKNANEQIVFGDNFLNCSYGYRNSDKKNRVTIKGKNNFVWTSEDSTDQIYPKWVKSINISDSALETVESIKNRADVERSKLTYSSKTGVFNINNALPTAFPSQSIRIKVPRIESEYVIITSINGSISFSSGYWSESIGVEQDMTDIIFDLENFTNNISTGNNPDGFSQGFFVSFKESPTIVLNQSNVVETTGQLTLDPAATSGSCNTKAIDSPINLVKGEFLISGSSLDNCYYKVSVDGGKTIFDVENEQVLTFSGIDNKRVIIYFNLVKADNNRLPIIKYALFRARGTQT